MKRLSFIFGSMCLAMTQANAELIINGSTTSTVTPVQNSSASNQSYSSNNSFQNCIANLRSQAVASGVSGDTYNRYTQNLTPDYSVIDKLNYQPEFSTPIWDYMSGLVDQERVDKGREKIAQYRDVLNRVQAA